MSWSHLDTWPEIVQWLRGRRFAVLCGSGISCRAGLPTGQEFNKSFLNEVIVRDRKDIVDAYIPKEDSTAHTPTKPTSLRFEGMLEVWQQICDQHLKVLDTYRIEDFTSEHRALASLAKSHPILTTNFDSLIERAYIKHVDKEGLAPTFTDEQFGESTAAASGLFKIHGTLEKLVDGQLLALQPDEPGLPIVTLRSISANQESAARRAYVHAIRNACPLVVAGYSGSDDFDVSRWLIDAPDAREVLWIVHDSSETSPHVVSALDDKRTPRPLHRLRQMPDTDAARNWKIVVADTARVLSDISGEPYEGKKRSALLLDWKSPGDEVRSLVSASIMLQVCRLREAEEDLRKLLDGATLSPKDAALARLYLAQALLLTGVKGKRREAYTHASSEEIAKSTDASIKLRARFVGIQSAFFMGVSPPDEIMGDLRALYRDAKTENLMELTFEIAIFAFQQARGHRDLEKKWRVTAFDKTGKGGSLTAKGLRLHENARRNLHKCRTPKELDERIAHMREAIAFREDVGHIDGLCASLNVCGAMHQRLAEWTSFSAPDYSRAEKYHRRSAEIAEEAGCVWHHAEALIAQCYLFAKSGRDEFGEHLEKLRVCVCKMEDPRNRQLRLLHALKHLLDDDVPAALNIYKELHNREALAEAKNEKFSELNRDMTYFNMKLCEKWFYKERADDQMQLGPSHRGVYFWEAKHVFWQANLKQLGARSIVGALIDSLPPYNPNTPKKISARDRPSAGC